MGTVLSCFTQPFAAAAVSASFVQQSFDHNVALRELWSNFPKSEWHRSCNAEKVLVIGDVHGCLGALKDLLEQVDDLESRTVVLLGDIVNKGEDNVGTVRYAMKNNFLSVRGNHDDACLIHRDQRVNVDSEHRPDWQWADELADDEVQWLQNLPFTISLPKLESICVHAGLVPGVSLSDQDPLNMTKMRELKQNDDGSFSAFERSKKVDGAQPWASLWNHAPHVYFGHDARRGIQQYKFATGLDSGCVYNRQLSAVLLPEKTMISVARSYKAS